jgi:hypothetical protein
MASIRNENALIERIFHLPFTRFREGLDMTEKLVAIPRRIDVVDRRILRAIQEDAELSAAAIRERGRAVGVGQAGIRKPESKTQNP